ncbi:uncharacterized protein HKW66_Vig0113220 [Vigna angularis]|uniref:Uncharacterized protein n=1 Tax=Phaseolus angularis TaxID=3914 RepID=A0A8T0KVQ1_PHAAN|nr:uncharacterized protein HKW66_Vig0113220 [Vigna angularis]
MNESSVHGNIGPSTGDMSVLTNIGSYHRLSVVVKAEHTAEAEGRVEIPGEFAGAEGVGQIQLPLVAVRRYFLFSSLCTHPGQSQTYRCDRHDRDTFRFLHAPFETTPALTGSASRGASDSVAT